MSTIQRKETPNPLDTTGGTKPGADKAELPDEAGHPRRMTLRERVIACVQAHRGTAICVHCMAAEIGASAKSVYETVRQLSFPPRARVLRFVKTVGICPACRLKRQVYATNPA